MYSKERVGNDYMKRTYSLVIIKKIQFKTTMRYHLKCIRFDINRISDECDEDM